MFTESTDLGVIGNEGDYTFDTFGSDYDTEIGLYDMDGNLLADNDDDAVGGLQSQVIEDLAAQGTGVDHPLLREAEQLNTIAYVVITSDRGLAGPYNSAVIRAAEREIMAAHCFD